MLHQAAHALAELAHEHAVVIFPKTVRVVHYNTVRTLLDGGVYQPVAETDPGHDFRHLVRGLHAKSVHAIVLESSWAQELVQPQ